MTLEPRIDRLETEVSEISQRVDQLGQRVANLEGEVRQLGERITSLENNMNARLSDTNSRLNILTLVVFGNVAATILSAVGIVVAVLIRS